MRILVTGASGLVGSALCPALEAAGHAVVRLARSGPVSWSPTARSIDGAALDGIDAVVHLAGESVAGRWTPARKQRILASRRDGTRFLAETLAALPEPPKVLVSASAIGFYGDRHDELLTEQSPAGTGFLAEVARQWEAATAPAAAAGIRVVTIRTGIVLTRNGGALPAMLPPFRLGLGGPIGSGRQWWSWLALADLVAIYERALADASLAGPVNAVAPGAVTNREFARTLGRVLGRPALLPLPAPAVKLLLGEMGVEMLLAGAHVQPAVLTAAGFAFRFPQLGDALQAVLRP
jgi:hypothetical protein